LRIPQPLFKSIFGSFANAAVFSSGVFEFPRIFLYSSVSLAYFPLISLISSWTVSASAFSFAALALWSASKIATGDF